MASGPRRRTTSGRSARPAPSAGGAAIRASSRPTTRCRRSSTSARSPDRRRATSGSPETKARSFITTAPPGAGSRSPASAEGARASATSGCRRRERCGSQDKECSCPSEANHEKRHRPRVSSCVARDHRRVRELGRRDPAGSGTTAAGDHPRRRSRRRGRRPRCRRPRHSSARLQLRRLVHHRLPGRGSRLPRHRAFRGRRLRDRREQDGGPQGPRVEQIDERVGVHRRRDAEHGGDRHVRRSHLCAERR